MKFLIKILCSLALFAWLTWLAAVAGAPVFLRDMIELHGSGIADASIEADIPVVDWRVRQVRWNGWELKHVNNNREYIFNLNEVDIKLPQEMDMDFSSPSTMLSPLRLDKVEIKRIELVFDVDSGGGNLRAIRESISNAAGMALRDRLNANAKAPADVAAPLLLVVSELRVDSVVVEARGNGASTNPVVFPVTLATFADLGRSEGGITAAEIADRVSRALLDEIRRQAGIRGIIDTGRRPESMRNVDEQSAGESDQSDQEEQGVSGKVKKAAQTVGHGFRDLGRDIKQGFRKLRD